MPKTHQVAVGVLILPLLAGCMIPVLVQSPETAAPAVQDVSVGPGPGENAAQAGASAATKPAVHEESPAPVFPAARQAPVEQRTVTITGRTWADAPGQPGLSAHVYAPKGEFKFNWQSERLGITNALGQPFTFDVPATDNGKSLVVFADNTGREGRLYLKSMYVGHERPTVDLGDIVLGYKIGQTLDGDPGTIKLTFPGGHQETKRTVEVVPMRTLAETGLFMPHGAERMESFYQEGAWHTPIEPKTVAVVETGDEPSVTIKGLDNHRWYAVRVKMDLPGGGQAVTSVNSFLAGRDVGMQISNEQAKCVGCIDVEQRQLSPEEVAEWNQKVAEGGQ